MTDDPFPALVQADTEGQVAEARACGLAVVAYFTALTDGGLPKDLAAELTAQYAAAPQHVWLVEED